MKRSIVIIISLFLLTGCWDNHELEDTAIVHGVGLDKIQDKIHVSVEIIKPGGSNQGEERVTVEGGDHLVLEDTTDTLLDGARELIKYTKRRLDFGHTEVWLIGEKMARDDMVSPLDVIRRNPMLRLNSQLFISKDNPTAILNTPTFYEHLVSNELFSSMEQTKFVSEYAPITLREFYKAIEGPTSSAYVPIIYISENNQQEITIINGTAVINKNQMVGELNAVETAGLNLLLNNVQGGSIQLDLNEQEKVSLEISKATTKTIPKLTGEKLHVNIQTEVTGTLADNITSSKINERFYKEIEEKFSEHTKGAIQSTLDKLQREFKTDITDIGPKTYRKHPKKWADIRLNWDEVFASAKIVIDVQTNITHQGLINENTHHRKRPYNNPYHYFKSE